jgi:streptogramin lyase
MKIVLRVVPGFLFRVAVIGALIVMGSGCPQAPPGSDPDLRVPVDLSARRVPGTRLDTPWGIAWDAGSGAYYIGNAGGKVGVRDGRGWISRLALSEAGVVGTLEAEWLGGLDAPLGVAAAGGKLYVADLDVLVTVDIATRAVNRVMVPGARLLSSVAVSGATPPRIYLADAVQRSLYLYTPPAAPVLLLQSDDLLAMTAIALDAEGARLWVASRGSLDDLLAPGRVQQVDLATLRLTQVGLPAQVQPGGILVEGSGAVLVTDISRAGLLGLPPGAGSAGAFTLRRDLRHDGLQLAGALSREPRGTVAVVDPLGGGVVLLSPEMR